MHENDCERETESLDYCAVPLASCILYSLPPPIFAVDILALELKPSDSVQ